MNVCMSYIHAERNGANSVAVLLYSYAAEGHTDNFSHSGNLLLTSCFVSTEVNPGLVLL